MSGAEKVVSVTGASGYIASWVVKLLLQRGYTVKASVRDPSQSSVVSLTSLLCLINNDKKKTKHLLALDGAKERLQLFKADLLEEGSFDSVVEGSEGVFHTASPFYHDVSDPQLWYMISKTLAEEAAWKFTKENGIDMVAINPGLVIGPLLQPTLNTSVEPVLKLINGAETFPNITYRWVDVKDVANAHILAFENASASGRYCLVGRITHCSEVVKLLRDLFPALKIPEKCTDDKPFTPTYQVSKERAQVLGVKYTPLEECNKLPMALSNISSLHVLDLAENQFNGSIPASFGDFKAMAQAQNMNRYLFYGMYRGRYYDESLIVNLKGSPQKYTKTLSLVISIDLSGNNLSGDLPEETTKLSGLVVLNLSGNQISGGILQDISKLTQLQSLDLSSNRFSGLIPQSLSSLSFLGYLNLSNNDFSGMIPYTAHLTTFDAASFTGNPGLCGPPLVVSCPGADPGKGGGTVEDNDSGDSFIDKWFYLSVGLGFAAGLLVPFFILAIRKPWSDAYFRFVDKVLERISCLRNRRAVHHRTRRPHLS